LRRHWLYSLAKREKPGVEVHGLPIGSYADTDPDEHFGTTGQSRKERGSRR
jgi:hypothetical protein